MSAVIKSSALGDATAVRPIGLAGMKPEPWIDPEIAVRQAEIERLTKTLRDCETRIAEHPAALEQARTEGHAMGRQAGLTEADDGRAALLTAIKKAADSAIAELKTTLASLERLAPALAVAGLEKVLGPDADRARLMRQLIGRQLAGMKDQAVIAVEVSAADFAGEQLDALSAALAKPGLAVRAMDTLKSGDCRLVLQLGAIEAGVDQQWGRLRDLLTGLTTTPPDA